MKKPDSLPTQQIGKLGELLVQYQLLRYGIESARMTTDSGIDLVTYSHNLKQALTIQVKANLKPKPSGGTGGPCLDWWVKDDSPADLFAFVDISENRVWLLTKKELGRLAQQHPRGRYHFCIRTDPGFKPRNPKVYILINQFEPYRLEYRIKGTFK